jgi:hypothetical protein
VADVDDQHPALAVVYAVQDAVVADANAKLGILPLELHRPAWEWLSPQGGQSGIEAFDFSRGQPS